MERNSHIKVSYNYLGSPIQADNSRGSQCSHIFFILLNCYSWGKFEETLVTSNL